MRTNDTNTEGKNRNERTKELNFPFIYRNEGGKEDDGSKLIRWPNWFSFLLFLWFVQCFSFVLHFDFIYLFSKENKADSLLSFFLLLTCSNFSHLIGFFPFIVKNFLLLSLRRRCCCCCCCFSNCIFFLVKSNESLMARSTDPYNDKKSYVAKDQIW